MIVGSLFLLVAVVLLARGLATGSVVYLVASVAASLVAVVALVVKARQAGLVRFAGARRRPAASRTTADPTTGPPDADWVEPDEVLVGEVMERRATPAAVPSPPVPDPAPESVAAPEDDDAVVPQDIVVPPDGPEAPVGDIPGDVVRDDEQEPPDEAPAERLSRGELAQLATMPDEVRVIDGRPRFHSADCPVLPLYEHEPLPVSEAVELGFTPCADCAAGSGLLTRVPG